MNKVFTWLALGITTIGLIVALLLGMARMQSAPIQGEKLAARANIPHPAIVAHRGASYLAPESSRPAYLLARELGADYLEFDLQRTKDGVLVAVHDADLRRVTNVEEVFPGRSQDPVDRFTFAELQQLDAGSWFNLEFPDRARESFQGLKILRLEDVLDIAEDGSPQPGVYIETKLAERYRGIEKQLVQALIGRGWIRPPPTAAPNPVRPIAPPSGPARVIFQSFDRASLGQLKILAPGIPRLLLLDEVLVSESGWESVLGKAKEVGTGVGTWGYQWAHGPGWSQEASSQRYMTTWPWYIGEVHQAGLFVHPWTIDDRWEMWMLRLCGADGIFTNRPELAVLVYDRVSSINLGALWERIGY